MNLEKTAVVTIRASLGDGLAVSKKQAQEAWGQVLSKLGCRQDDEKISIASFIEAHRRHGEKLAGLERCLADTTRKMVQKASEGGYRDFSGLGLTFVLRRSACRVCPGVRRLAGLTIWARASTKNTGSQNMNRVAVARELVKIARELTAGFGIGSPGGPEPKFKKGDKVRSGLPGYTEVWSVGDYDEFLGDRRYVVMNPKTRHKLHLNEKGIKKAHGLDGDQA